MALISTAMFLPSELLPTPFTHIAAAALLIVGTVAVPEVWLNTINAQTYLGLLAVLLLFVEVDEIARPVFVGVVVTLAVAVFTGLYAMVLAPLFVFQYVKRRTTRRAIVTAVVAGTTLVQVVLVAVSHTTGHLAEGRSLRFPGFGVLTRDVGAGHVSMFLFGGGLAERLHAHAYSFPGLLAFATLALVVLGGLALVLLVVPNRRVAGMLVAAFVLVEALVSFGDIHNAAGGRYAVVPIGLLTLALVHATTARPSGVGTAAAVVCGLVLVSGLINFWSYHPRVLRCVKKCPNWTAEVTRFQHGGSNTLTIWPYPHPNWHVTIPKSRR